jgi:hydroxymethylpyrimidine/phosphomethylpyrimidine kinase
MTRNKPLQPRVLIIAGSDCSGGAGIQADIKTVSTLGGYAATAITAVTVQNTLGVTGVHTIPPKTITDQIEAVLSDIGADAIKIGMLGDVATIKAVAKALKSVVGDIPIVVDPVMVAKGGAKLLAKSAVSALKVNLMPLATLLTPNIPEAEVLTAKKIKSVEDMVEAANHLLTMGPKAVLVKGGHLVGDELTDVLVEQGNDEQYLFQSNRIDTTDTHGTGCTMASAIATFIASDTSMVEAIDLAQNYVFKAIQNAPGLGKGHGPLGHNRF